MAAAQGTLRQGDADRGPFEDERSAYLSAKAASRLAPDPGEVAQDDSRFPQEPQEPQKPFDRARDLAL
jgi:hypothetical protein